MITEEYVNQFRDVDGNFLCHEYVFDQANKLLQAAKIIADTDPDWWEVWNDEPFQQEVIDDLITVARRVNQMGVRGARAFSTPPHSDSGTP